MSRRLVVPLLFGGLAVALIPAAPPASGCAVVPNKDGHVAVANELAVIVFDEETKTEHFVRKATFQSTSADFGFLVPTPSVPELVEATGDAFAALAKLTEPKVEVRRVETTNFGCEGLAPTAMAKRDVGMNAAALPPGGVQVAQKVNVAGYDAVSLKADDPKELNDWLGKNGYVSRPSLVEWFKWYTENKWVITAFKLGEGAQAAGNGRYRIDNRLVRMSFKTDRPFYPYREPADAAAQSGLTSDRLLRVYLLASAKSLGRIGVGPDPTDWPGRTVWAGLVDSTAVERVGSATKLAGLKADRPWVLTEFEDRSFPRPASDDVYFGPDPDPSPVERPKRIEYVYVDVTNQKLAAIGIFAGILPIVAVVGLVVALKLLRKK
jgi:Uncharacterized protein conserved in bacteria (DUF2330)